MKRTAAALRAVWGLALAAAVASDEAHRREDSMMGFVVRQRRPSGENEKRSNEEQY